MAAQPQDQTIAISLIASAANPPTSLWNYVARLGRVKGTQFILRIQQSAAAIQGFAGCVLGVAARGPDARDPDMSEWNKPPIEPWSTEMFRNAAAAKDPVTAGILQASAERMREREGPPELCIEDGIDGAFFPHLKKSGCGVVTDEQGRVVLLGMFGHKDSLSLNEQLAGLAGLRHVQTANVRESF
jgi:hypothetical protein